MKPATTVALSAAFAAISTACFAGAWHLNLGAVSSVPFIFGIVWGASFGSFITYAAMLIRFKQAYIK